MVEILKNYYFEIAAVFVTIFILLKVKKIARKLIGIIFSLAAIARVIMMFMK